MRISLGLALNRRRAGAGGTATIAIYSVGPQEANGDVPVSYGISRNDSTVEVVVFVAAEPDPVAADFGGANPTYVDQGTVNLTTSGSPINLDLTGTFNGSVKLAFLPTGGGDADVVVSSAFTLDTTAPTLSGLTGTQTGATTATAAVTSNEAGGTIYFGVRPTAASALTAAQLIAGSGGAGVAWSSDASPTADGTNAGSFTGLTASTTYRVDAVQVDSKGNQSAVVSSGEFTTAAAVSITRVASGALGTVGSVGAGTIVMADDGFHVLCLLNDDASASAATVLFNGVSPTESITSGNAVGGNAEIHYLTSATAGSVTITFVGTSGRHKHYALYRLVGYTATGNIDSAAAGNGPRTLSAVPDAAAIIAIATNAGGAPKTVTAVDTTQDVQVLAGGDTLCLTVNTGTKSGTGNVTITANDVAGREAVAGIAFPVA